MKKRSDEDIVVAAETEEDRNNKRKESRHALMVYSVVLFVFVMAIMMLSYFAQQRISNAAISDLTEQHSEFSIQALENIEALQKKNEELTEKLEQAQNRIGQLEVAVEQTKLDWAEDVNNVEDTLKTDVNNEMLRREAVEKLLELYIAVENGGDVETALAAMEPLADKLDGAYTELYKSIKQQTE